MEFKNKIELDLHIDYSKLDGNNKYELTPKLLLIIYSREQDDQSWEQIQTLEFYNVIDIETINQRYLEEIDKLSKQPEETAPITSDDPDDIPF